MPKNTTVPSRRIVSAAKSGDRQTARRAMDTTHASLRAETAALKREEAVLRAREKKAVPAYLKGLARAGADLARLPIGVGLVSREDRARSVARRSHSRATATTSFTVPRLGWEGLTDPVIFLPPIGTLTPPYAYNWTWTKVIHYAPGELSATADRVTGKFQIDMAASHNSNQVNKCRARAAIGVWYRPAQPGLLGIRPVVDVDWSWHLKTNYAAARTYGWTGILVHAFDATTDELVSVPVDKKQMEFNESEDGSLWPSAEFTVELEGGNFWNTTVPVSPSRWYAIWIWCGGGIRAAGWQTQAGVNVGSDATSRVHVRVPSIALYFGPLTVHSGPR
jgi:hypothetical protein